jgi:hypothetical protein
MVLSARLGACPTPSYGSSYFVFSKQADGVGWLIGVPLAWWFASR